MIINLIGYKKVCFQLRQIVSIQWNKHTKIDAGLILLSCSCAVKKMSPGTG